MKTFRTGVQDKQQVSLENSPAQVLRIYTNISSKMISQTAVRIKMAREAGLNVLPYMEENAPDDETWQRAISEWVDTVSQVRGTYNPVYEVGNEAGPGPNDENWALYFHRLEIASPIIRSYGGKVLLMATYPTLPGQPEGGVTEKFLRKAPFHLVDGVALHPYSRTATGTYNQVVKARTLVPSTKPLYVTEFGWATRPIGDPKPSVTLTQQADFVTETYRLFRANLKALDLRIASVFCHKDYPDSSQWDGVNHLGLVNLDGTPKPALERLAAIPRLTSY